MSNNSMPDNNGTNSQNKYYLRFDKIEGSPTYEIISTLTIGSEEGDVVLNEAISGKHCSILKNNGVLSIIDHNSVEGTFISGRQVSAGRVYLLEQSDQIRIGSLDVTIQVVEQTVEAPNVSSPSNPPPIPEEDNFEEFTGSFVQSELAQKIPLEATGEFEVESDETGDFDLSELEETKVGIKEKVLNLLNKFKKKNTQGLDEYYIEEDDDDDGTQDFDEEIEDFEPETTWRDKVPFIGKYLNKSSEPREADHDMTRGSSTSLISLSSLRLKQPASALYRLIAVFGDFLLSIGIVNIFAFEDFIEILDFGKEKVMMIYTSVFSKVLQPVLELGFIKSLGLDSFSELSGDIVYYLLTFAMLRVVGTLLMGLSPTQFIIGLSGTENLVYNHALGAIREILGLFTGPLLVFDLPALIQKPTLKELVTLSRVNSVSSTSNFIRTVLFVPLIVVFAYLSPFFKGFEESKVHLVNHKNPFKFTPADKYYHNSELSTFLPEMDKWSYSLSVSSKLKSGKKSKKQQYLNYSLVGFHYHDKNIYSEIMLLKRFSIVELLDLYFADSTNGAANYPNLYQLFLNSKVKKKSMSLKFSKRNQADMTNEFTSLLKEVMEVDITKSIDYIIKGEYWLKGLFNFREAFLNLVGGNIDSVDVVPLRGITFLRIIHNLGANRHETLIPMMKNGIVLRHSYKTDLPFGASQKIVLTKMLNSIKWFEKTISFSQNKKNDDPVELFFRTQRTGTLMIMNKEEFSRLYDFYFFQISKDSLYKNDFHKKIYMTKIKKYLKFLSSQLKVVKRAQKEESYNLISDFYQRLNQLYVALETNNESYFTTEQVEQLPVSNLIEEQK